MTMNKTPPSGSSTMRSTPTRRPWWPRVSLTAPSRASWLIVGARGLRSFAYGLMAVVLGVALLGAGLSPVAVGGIVAVSLAGDFGATYLIAALGVAALVTQLPSTIEAAPQPKQDLASRWRRLLPPLGRSRDRVLALSGLFSVDALAGGLVVQSLMALYFHLRFGADLAL